MSGLTGIALLDPYVASASLVLARCSGTVLLAPVFSAQTIPVRVRAGITLVLALVLTAHVGPIVHERSAFAIAVGAAGELLVGLVIGLLFRLVLLVAETAGELAGLQMGFGFAQLADPLTQETSDITTQLLGAFAVLLLLAADGHRLVIAALAASLHNVPLGTGLARLASLPAAASWLGSALETALRLAAPVIVALLLCNVALGLLARAAPQLNLFVLGFAISIAVGLIVLDVVATSGLSLMIEQLQRIPARLDAVWKG